MGIVMGKRWGRGQHRVREKHFFSVLLSTEFSHLKKYTLFEELNPEGCVLLQLMIIIIDNFCIALFSGVPKLTALYNILQHFLSFTNIIHIIMTTNNV